MKNSDFTNEMRRYASKPAAVLLNVLVVIPLRTESFEFSLQGLKTNPIKPSGHSMHHFL